MGTDPSKSQIDKLGERLRRGQPLASDVEILETHRRSFDDAQETVVQVLRSRDLQPSGRIKTTISIVAKLRRESTRLSRLQDIAGCRIVVEGIEEQDRLAEMVVNAFPNTAIIDRREKPSHGYRAIHAIVPIGNKFVEVQIRTELQHLWAVWSETLADSLDPSIKYGGGPEEVRDILSLGAKLVALVESRDHPLTELRLVRDAWLGKSLPQSAVTRSVGFKDLLRHEQEVKDRLTREILALESKRQKL